MRKGDCIVRGTLTAVKPEYFHKREKLFPKIQCVSVYFKDDTGNL